MYRRAGLAAVGLYAGWKLLDSYTHLSFDIDFAKRLLPIKKQIQERFARPGGFDVTSLWYETLAKHPSKTCFLYEDTSLTFADARRDSAEDFSRLNALLFTAMAWIFIPAYCFAIP